MKFSENILFDNMLSAKINPFKNKRTLKTLSNEEFKNNKPIDLTYEIIGVLDNQVLFSPSTGTFSQHTLR